MPAAEVGVAQEAPTMPERLIGHYKIESELGAGGMGVVFQATDSRLGRRVALKLLREDFVRDPDRLARFEREARVLASLNHPNIAAIHGIEKAGDVSFLVLEFVPGDTLADRIAKGPLSLKETLDIGRQLAEGLEAAHAQGVIHRDLKPANIKITPDGKVKVLDFGLAKALADAHPPSGETETATIAAGITETGIVMGTAAYMSPEQASGKPLDQRTDIWSFGCVLFEALTGRRTFAAQTTTELLVSILDREPDWSLLPATTPENIQRLLRRCLAKDPRQRLHDIADARLELDDTLSGRLAAFPQVAAPATVRGRTITGLAAGLAIGIAGTALWLSLRKPETPPPRVVRFSFDLPQGSRIAPGWDPQIAFSRDSKELIYPVSYPPPLVLFSRRLDSLEIQPPDALKGLSHPIHSPDGRWMAALLVGKGTLAKIPRGGGAPVVLAPVTMPFRGDWGPDGYVYWTNTLIGGVVRVSENGGDTQPVTELNLEKQERVHRYVRLLPGGKGLVYSVATGDIDTFDDARIDVFDLNSKKATSVVQGGASPRYSPSGHIVYARGGSLYAVPFDLKKLQPAGSPVKVLDGVLMSTNIGSAYYDISPAGDLAYAPGPAESGDRTLHWVDRKGNATPLPLPPRSYLNARISPEGNQIAVEVEGPNHDFYIHDVARGVTSRITNDGVSHGPIWSPDGKRIVYRSWRDGMMTLYWMPSDRSGPPERLMKTTAWQHAVSFSPDGSNLIFDQWDRENRISNVWVLPMTGERQPRPLSVSRFSEGGGKFSPDGQWIVYCSMESGKAEVYVQSWPGPGPKIQISSDGGMDPIWRRDGKEIFYRNGYRMMAVAVSLGPPLQAGRPQVLWEGPYTFSLSSSCGLKGVTTTSYDVAPDGQRFLMTKDNEQKMYSTRIIVVLNWVEELKRIVAEAAGKKT